MPKKPKNENPVDYTGRYWAGESPPQITSPPLFVAGNRNIQRGFFLAIVTVQIPPSTTYAVTPMKRPMEEDGEEKSPSKKKKKIQKKGIELTRGRYNRATRELFSGRGGGRKSFLQGRGLGRCRKKGSGHVDLVKKRGLTLFLTWCDLKPRKGESADQNLSEISYASRAEMTNIRKLRGFGFLLLSSEEKLEPPQAMNALMKLNQLKPGLQYKLVSQTGPVHAPIFTMSVEIDGSTFEASGPSKKTAKLHVAVKVRAACPNSRRRAASSPTSSEWGKRGRPDRRGRQS